ncbi:hypothetical protein JCM10908_000571 [Rhodotorula pacifica]|uniref:peroxiredoxin-like family protein n=1 Tax=Rhodotorula pacifica TaxID=1495444 RepID=UPI00317039C1
MATSPAFSKNALPTAQELDAARQVPVYDSKGTQVLLGSLFEPDQIGGTAVVVFIRHFLCGLCQDYLSLLASKLPPSLLAEHKVRLSVVGCGDYKMIDAYRDHLSCPFPIYSDESKKAYEVLGMTKRTYDLGAATPEYQKKGMGSTVWTSIGSFFKMGKLANPGDSKQIGGEFAFSSSGQPTWCHRMENTRDHAPLRDLAQAAGLPYTP